MTPELAGTWLDRWDAQQERHVTGREARFAAIGEVVASAAVSTTALHHLPMERLGALYDEAAALLRPGGVLVNAFRAITPTEPQPVARVCGTGRSSHWQDWMLNR
ncbi:class I SAM-dependent methyltransferase [Nonomuraea sp. NPDC059194]|uniref:class I SAM-dependent methyltransferase n=1 Tax=Nonomuraea sp. NPDC059194 TaxID=3346764 RepID=UPI003673D243